jgi:ADP-ribose pyrophosphatase YjhB (NUDIX family)
MIENISEIKVCLLYNHELMKTILLRIWKWLPFRMQKIFSRILMPSFQVFAAGVIFNPKGQILLGKTTYQRIHPWGLPGGSLKYGEEPQDAVVREVWEETGLEIEVKELLLVKNSSARDQIGLFFWSEIRGGALRPSDEMTELRYFYLDKLPDVRPSDAILLKQLAGMVAGAKK